MEGLLDSSLVLSIGMAVAAGLVGCFAVMRRMTLASDALSHVALPGIGVALALHVHPVLGGLLALFVGTILIWALERSTRVPTEAVIGVVFSAALAVGSLLTSGEDLIEALFGSGGSFGTVEMALGLGAVVLVVAFLLRAKSRLVIALVSRDLARTAGIDVGGLDLLYLLSFALAVALGLRFLGVLLMGSLVIIPASTAKIVSRGLNRMLLTSVAIAVFSTLAGSLLARALGREAGPFIILAAASVFLGSLFVRRTGEEGAPAA